VSKMNNFNHDNLKLSVFAIIASVVLFQLLFFLSLALSLSVKDTWMKVELVYFGDKVNFLMTLTFGRSHI